MLNEVTQAATSFPGITGYIDYSNAYQYMAPTIIACGAVLFMLILIYGFCKVFSGRKSKDYRELITDMYVVGMIKKFATEDKVSIINELRDYLKMEKKAKLAERYLDEVIEGELKEKVAKLNEEKTKDLN